MYPRRGWHGRGGRIERFQVAALLLLLRERKAHGYDLLDRLPELVGDVVALGARVHAVEPARISLEERLLGILRPEREDDR